MDPPSKAKAYFRVPTRPQSTGGNTQSQSRADTAMSYCRAASNTVGKCAPFSSCTTPTIFRRWQSRIGQGTAWKTRRAITAAEFSLIFIYYLPIYAGGTFGLDYSRKQAIVQELFLLNQKQHFRMWIIGQFGYNKVRIGIVKIFKVQTTHRIELYYNISTMEQVINLLKEHQALEGAELEEKTIVVAEIRGQGTEPIHRVRNFIEGTISQNVSQEKYGKIIEALEEKQIAADISQALPTGGPFGDYGEIDNVFDEGKTHLHHKAGEVLLVDVWATWCGPCQRPMQHNQELLQKNEALWGDKVRIVGVSVDEEKETIVARVNTRKWTKVQHLTLLGWKGEHHLIKSFGITGIPFVCLVDKFGKIAFTGHPSSIKLEDKINELLKQETQVIAEAAPPAPFTAQSLLVNKPIIALFAPENFKVTFQKSDLICIKASFSTSFKNGTVASSWLADVFVRQGDQQSNDLLKQLLTDYPDAKLNFKEVEHTTVPITENPTCWECKAALTFPYYWLKWEHEPHFGCRKCVEKPSTEEGHHFAYEKNTVLLVGPTKEVDTKKLGSNTQPQKTSEVESGHHFCCNCCGGSSGVGQARYICIGCRPEPNFKGDFVDICQGCLEGVVAGSQEILKQLENENHKSGHPLLRILYNTKGYYEY